MKDRPFQLTDIVRETSYAIHRYHGCGHLEKVYENALVHHLRKLGLKVQQQWALTVYTQSKGKESCRKKRKKTKDDGGVLV